MSLRNFTSTQVELSEKSFGGGLNTTAGDLTLTNAESSDLQNIDFNRFGSFFQREGFTVLNSSAIANSPEGDGLYWFEFDSAGTLTRKAVSVADGKLFKMDDLDGTWDDITGGLTITASNQVDFETFTNEVYMTNGTDAPWLWTGAGDGATMTVPTGLTDAKFVALYNNTLFLANVTVSGSKERTRVYFSGLKDTGTWDSADFLEVGLDDGEEITGMRVLGDRLVIYKSRSIWSILFTGDPDIRFILPGGGKTNSPVGAVSGFSIQDALNGHIFLAYDGLWIFDGANSFKLSDRINVTIDSFNDVKFPKVVSMNQKTKNKYWASFSSSGSSENDTIITWDYASLAFSKYSGINAAAMATFYVSGTEERVYFMDYAGFVYRADDLAANKNDNPEDTETAIDSFYKTNWRSFEDNVNQKGVPEVVIYYEQSDSILTFGYSYDFEEATSFSQTIDISAGGDKWGQFNWGEGQWGGSGGDVIRQDLTGRGRVIRLVFSNNTLGETFRIEGLGTGVYVETNV